MYDGGDALPEGYGLSLFDPFEQYEELRARAERRLARQERFAAAYDYSTTPVFQGRRADPSRLVPASAAPPGSEMVAGEQPTSPLVYVAAAGVAAVALYLLFKK
jgi:hypothetical protein